MVSDDNGWALERPQPRVPDSDGGSGFAAQYAAGRLAARGRPAGSGNSIPEQRQRGWVSSRPPSEGMMSHGEAADLSQIRDFNAQDSVLSTAPKPPPPPPPRQRSRHSLELPPPGFTEPPRPQASLPQAQRMEVSSSQSPINAPSASAEFWAQQQQQVLRTCRQGSASAGDLNNDHWTSLQAQATAPLPASQHQQQSWQQLYAQASHSKSMPDLVVPQQKQEQTWGQQDAQAAHIPTGYGSGAAAAAAQAAAQVMAQLQAAQASPALQQPHPTFALHHGHEHIYSGGSVDTAPRGTPIAGASPSSLYLALQQHRGLLCGGLDLTTVHALQHLYQQQQQQQHSKQMPDQQQSDGMSQAWGSHTLQGHAIPGYEYGAPQPQPQTQPHMAWAVEQHDQLHHHHAGYEQGAPGLQVLHEEAIMSQRPGLHRIQPTTLPLPFEPPTGSILQASIQTMPKGLEHDPSSAGHITLPGQLHQMPAASGDDPQLHYPRSSPSSLQLAEASFSFSQPRASMVPVGVSLEMVGAQQPTPMAVGCCDCTSQPQQQPTQQHLAATTLQPNGSGISLPTCHTGDPFAGAPSTQPNSLRAAQATASGNHAPQAIQQHMAAQHPPASMATHLQPQGPTTAAAAAAVAAAAAAVVQPPPELQQLAGVADLSQYVPIAQAERLKREISRLQSEAERLEKETPQVARQKALRETERVEFAEAKERLKSSWAADREDFARVKEGLKRKNAEHHIHSGRLSQAVKEAEAVSRGLRVLCAREGIAVPAALDRPGGCSCTARERYDSSRQRDDADLQGPDDSQGGAEGRSGSVDQGGTSASPVGPGLRMLAGEELRRQGPADSSRLWSPNDAPSGTAEAAAGAAAIAGQLATALGQLSVALCSTAQAAEQRAEGSGNGASRVPVTPPPGQRSDPPRSCSAA